MGTSKATFHPVRLAIADPPYLGRGRLLYGEGSDRSTPFHSGGGSYFREGRKPTVIRTTEHKQASEWDDPARHVRLVCDLDEQFDGWAVAASRDSLPVYLGAAPDLHVAVWVRPNSVPGGAHILGTWEPVLLRVPKGRRRQVGRGQVRDVLTASAPQSGHVGAKPAAWTRWVLDMLWHQDGDDVVDLFPGSGSVSNAVAQSVLDVWS